MRTKKTVMLQCNKHDNVMKRIIQLKEEISRKIGKLIMSVIVLDGRSFR